MRPGWEDEIISRHTNRQGLDRVADLGGDQHGPSREVLEGLSDGPLDSSVELVRQPTLRLNGHVTCQNDGARQLETSAQGLREI